MDKEAMYTLLQELISAYGPCGQEEEVRQVCERYLEPLATMVQTDAAGNLIAKIAGGEAPPTQLIVHMDELSLIVKRITDEGKLIVEPLGGIYPFIFGQGLVDILGDHQVVTGVLSQGPMHISSESKTIHKIKPKEHGGSGEAIRWEDSYVVTRQTKEQLSEAGIYPGTRVVVARSRRNIQRVGDCLASYFLDNRAAIAIAIATATQMKLMGNKPAGDLYIVASVLEEVGANGACYAARDLPGDRVLALDVGPVAEEYDTKLSADPIVVYKDAVTLYDREMTNGLCQAAEQRDISIQRAVWSGYGSDASIPKRYGQTAQAGLLCFPTENTHGFEMTHEESLLNCAKIVEAFLI